MLGNGRFNRVISDDDQGISGIAAERTGANYAPRFLIISCSDSRVPTELIFNLAFFDVVNVSIAGNTVSDNSNARVLATIQRVLEKFSSIQDIIVLGHSGCGALTAACDSKVKVDKLPPELGELVQMIRNSIGFKETMETATGITTTVDASVATLVRDSTVAGQLKERKGLIIPAHFDVHNGEVNLGEAISLD